MAGSAHAPDVLMTIGYEGRSLDELLTALGAAGVTRVIDIRQHAQSRKRGFSRSQLEASLNEAGVAYEHLPALGSPKAARSALRSGGDLATFFGAYRQHLATQEDALAALMALARRERVVLLCFERDPATCHRSVVARVVADQTGLEVRDM